MIAASACKESLRAVAANTGVSHQRISQARTVIQHAPELVESVISGAQSLDDAYGEARSVSEQTLREMPAHSGVSLSL